MQPSLAMDSSGKRKRHRSESAESDECLPISKRINTLHIEGQPSSLMESHQYNNRDLAEDASLNNNLPGGSWNTTRSPPVHPLPFWAHSSSTDSTSLSSSSLGFSQTPQFFQPCSPGQSSCAYNSLPTFHAQHLLEDAKTHADADSQYRAYSSPEQAVQCNGVYRTDPQFYEHQIYSQNSESSTNPYDGNSRQGSSHDSDSNMDYDPELTAAENPFYYDANRTLFEAHVHRLRRERHNPEESLPSDFS